MACGRPDVRCTTCTSEAVKGGGGTLFKTIKKISEVLVPYISLNYSPIWRNLPPPSGSSLLYLGAPMISSIEWYDNTTVYTKYCRYCRTRLYCRLLIQSFQIMCRLSCSLFLRRKVWCTSCTPCGRVTLAQNVPQGCGWFWNTCMPPDSRPKPTQGAKLLIWRTCSSYSRIQKVCTSRQGLSRHIVWEDSLASGLRNGNNRDDLFYWFGKGRRLYNWIQMITIFREQLKKRPLCFEC